MKTIALGNRIKSLRTKRNLSQSLLAEQLNLSTAYIGLLEKGKRTGTEATLRKIASFFAIDEEEFLRLREEKGEIQSAQKQAVVPTYPDYIDAFARALCLVQEDTCRSFIADCTNRLQQKLYQMLKPLEHKELKQIVMDIRRYWFSLEASGHPPGWEEIQGYTMAGEKETYLALQLDSAALCVTLQYADKKQIAEFFPWLDQYHISFVDKHVLPHMTVPQKVVRFIWFSPAIPVLDRYRYLLCKDIAPDRIECSEKQLKWLIQYESRRQQKKVVGVASVS